MLDQPELPGYDKVRSMLDSDGLSDEDIAEIQAFARDNGGIEYAFAVMEDLRRQAYECLAVFPESENRSELERLFDFTIARQF